MEKFYKASNDAAFKAIFTKEKNRDLLEKLIETCLDRKVKVISLEPVEILKENLYVKGKTLDVLVTSNNEVINIEMKVGYLCKGDKLMFKFKEEVTDLSVTEINLL